MKKNIYTLLVFFSFALASIRVDAQETYMVNATNLNVRESPSINGKLLGQLSKGTIVSVVDTSNRTWWQISFYGTEGYVSASLLIKIEDVEEYKDWKKESANTGDNPECENIIPKYDYEMDNELLIHVGNTADAIVKLMSYSGSCIRIAYIKAGDSYSMKNIPEGTYYLRIAYGKDFRKNISNGQCIVKFLVDPSYKEGSSTLDYRKVKKPNTYINGHEYENWTLPSFELSLNVEYGNDDGFNTLKSSKISEDQFNK